LYDKQEKICVFFSRFSALIFSSGFFFRAFKQNFCESTFYYRAMNDADFPALLRTWNAATDSLPEMLSELYGLRRFHAVSGLHRISAILESLGNPERSFPSIHVAGTNGKGAVTSLVASALQESGRSVGLFTSPHILRFNERIRLNGKEIEDKDLAEILRAILPLIYDHNATFFEAAVAVAFTYFARRGVEVAVIETGLGGRLDATNVLLPECLLCTTITSIDFDHTQYLGDTLAKIASEKAGIIKAGAPCVVAERREELREIFAAKAREVAAPLSFVHDDYTCAIQNYNRNFSMQGFIVERAKHESNARAETPFFSPLSGEHQARNILTAFATLRALPSPYASAAQAEIFQRGVLNVGTNTGLRGRIELLRAAPPLLMDVAHNPAGVAALIRTLELSGYAEEKWNVVFAAMQDKDIEGLLEFLAPVTARLFAPALSFPRARKPEEVARKARKIGIPATPYFSVSAACTAATAEARPTMIVGSFHLAEEALRWWEE
jgi:dihydrofolate synthase/folylpolyglutamate synthase